MPFTPQRLWQTTHQIFKLPYIPIRYLKCTLRPFWTSSKIENLGSDQANMLIFNCINQCSAPFSVLEAHSLYWKWPSKPSANKTPPPSVTLPVIASPNANPVFLALVTEPGHPYDGQPQDKAESVTRGIKRLPQKLIPRSCKGCAIVAFQV